MSTYYFLFCDTHKQQTNAVSRSCGKIGPLGSSNETLLPFIVAHSGCNVRIVSEYDEDAFSKEYTEWTPDNMDKLATEIE